MIRVVVMIMIMMMVMMGLRLKLRWGGGEIFSCLLMTKVSVHQIDRSARATSANAGTDERLSLGRVPIATPLGAQDLPISVVPCELQQTIVL